MGHLLDRCDVLDVLEEAVTLRRPLSVELKGGVHFVDEARDVITQDGRDWVQFRDHAQIAVDDISFCAPVEPPEQSYDSKL